MSKRNGTIASTPIYSSKRELLSSTLRCNGPAKPSQSYALPENHIFLRKIFSLFCSLRSYCRQSLLYYSHSYCKSFNLLIYPYANFASMLCTHGVGKQRNSTLAYTIVWQALFLARTDRRVCVCVYM